MRLVVNGFKANWQSDPLVSGLSVIADTANVPSLWQVAHDGTVTSLPRPLACVGSPLVATYAILGARVWKVEGFTAFEIIPWEILLREMS